MVCRVINKKLLLKKIKQGLGCTSGSKIIAILGFSNNQKFLNLNIKDISDFNTVSRFILRNTDISDLKLTNIRSKTALNTYAGKRHASNMPVRGQKTRTNAGTRKKFNVI